MTVQWKRRRRNSREIQRKHAAPFRQVARVDPAVVRISAPSAECQAQASARSINTALFERAKKLTDLRAGEPVAFVEHLDQHAFGAATDAQRHRRSRPGELE